MSKERKDLTIFKDDGKGIRLKKKTVLVEKKTVLKHKEIDTSLT